MSNEVSVTRPDRRIRVVLLALSILCALIPAVVLILAVDADHKRAALAHDAASTAEAASQISLAVRSVERQLDAGAALAGASPHRGSMIRSFLQAVQSSNHDLISVGFVARYRTRPSRAAFPVYHAAGDRPYITVTVPINGEGTGLTAVLDGKTVTGRLHFLADAPGAGAYLFTTGGRLLAASGVGSPRASYAPVSGERPSQRIVEDGGGLEGLGLLRASTWYVTEKPIHGTNWVLLLERRQHGLLFSRFPLLFGAASVLFAALMALIAALFLRRCARGPAKRGLEDAVRRSEILLRETHHRVKNDLQILSSILHLSDRPGLAGGEHEILVESENRVHAISLTHELLYKSSHLAAGVSMRAYVSELIRRIETSLVGDTEAISIVSNIGDFFFDADTSVACGLLLNELLTNSIKYAFPNCDGGVILVRMERVGSGRYLMQVQDDGVGLPRECCLSDSGSLGMRLIRALTEQLGGSVSVESDPGTSWRILFDAREEAVAVVR